MPAARSFAAETLFRWGLVERFEDIGVCVSELATNAVVHGVPPGREFCLRLTAEDGMVRIEARDSGGGWPRVCRPDDGRCRGRGLYLVSELADDFGVTRHAVGKTVWCVFDAARPAHVVRPAGPLCPDGTGATAGGAPLGA